MLTSKTCCQLSIMPTHLTYTVREVAPYINWIYYFHAWGMEPRFAAIADVHDCPSCRASWMASFPAEERAKAREAMKLYDEAMEQLRQWADEPMCHALYLLAHAYSEGDDIVVGGKVRIPFLRQQHVGKAGYTLCLSDFIKAKNEDEDYIQMKTGIVEIDTLISVLKEHYNGIYRVSLETDYAHRILMPSYFGYHEQEAHFSQLLTKYIDDTVHPDYQRPVTAFLNYDAIRHQLAEGEIPCITYKKANGETVSLRVYQLDESANRVDETLWIFAKE